MAWNRAVGTIGAAVLTIIVLTPRVVADMQPQHRLTLYQAIEEAFARSPVLQAERTLVQQAEARLRTAKTYPYNPALILEGARRDSPADRVTDSGIRIEQEIEIGGKRGRRTAEASAALAAARAGFVRQERLLTAAVRFAFVEALRGRDLFEVERANTELARSLAAVASKRFEAGAVPQMEVNLALVQVGRAERDFHLAEGAYRLARIALAQTLGMDPATPPLPDGTLDLPVRTIPALSDLMDSALERRADLQAFRRTTDAFQARMEAARREVIPNLLVAAFYGREEKTDRLLGGQIGIRIPIFNRNRGPLAEAVGQYQESIAVVSIADLQARGEVAAAFARYQAASAGTENLKQQVLGSLAENLGLLQRSFESGKTSWTEVLVFRREFVDVQREYVETTAEARFALIELDLASASRPSRIDQETQP